MSSFTQEQIANQEFDTVNLAKRVLLAGSNYEALLNALLPLKAILIGASDGTKIQALNVDAQGSLKTIYPDFTIPANSVTAAGVIFSQDCAGWESIAVQVTSAGTGCTVTYEQSNDNVNWVASVMYGVGNTGNVMLFASSTSANIWATNCTARYFRARVSTYGSGTVTASGYLRGCTVPAQTIPGNQDSSAVATPATMIAGKVRTAVDTTFVANDAQMTTQTSDMQTLVKPYGLPEADWQAWGAKTDTTILQCKAATAGIRNYVTGIQYQNTGATATDVQILDNATVIWKGYAPANMALPASIDFNTPLRASVNAPLNIACGITGSNTYLNAQGYQAL